MRQLTGLVVALLATLVFVPTALAAPLVQESETIGDSGWVLFLLALVPIAGVTALVFAFRFYQEITQLDEGTDEMVRIAQAVREGAMAYLRRQYLAVLIVFAVLFAVFFTMASFELQNMALPFAFLTAGFFSGLSGFFGMRAATQASARTAHAARTSLNGGLQVAFRGGAVMGLGVVGFVLLDMTLWFTILYFFAPSIGLGTLTLSQITVIMLSAAMGASTQALFARVGGGIYTKAADVGADLVGKVEAGIPEDDPRNPATIADNVGDNVGDVAGMGADLYESYLGSILATAALGVAAVSTQLTIDPDFLGTHSTLGVQLHFMAVPFIVAAVGLFISIASMSTIKADEGATMGQLMWVLNRSVLYASAGIAIVTLGVVFLLLPLPPLQVFAFWIAILSGLGVGILIGLFTEYYTSGEYGPTQSISKQGATGPATVIISGLAVGMRSTAAPVLAVVVGLGLSFYLVGGDQNTVMGLYGIGLAAVAMLSTLSLTLATDAYGPIADNAGGNAEMAELPPEVRQRTDQLDAVGNTTAATGKGFAIGSAALTALALQAAYAEEVRNSLIRNGILEVDVFGETVDVATMTLEQMTAFFNVTLLNPSVLIGLFIGGATVILFAAMTMEAVGRAAGAMVEEVRRQFREIPGILDGSGKPDYARCVAISTAGAQREMIAPSLLAILVPIMVGAIFGPAGVLGLLVGGLSTGFVMAVLMANAGGAWDNAKKLVESGEHGGKGSEAHRASVVGDTVGDPFKDATGPSINILIKLMSMVSIVFVSAVIAIDNTGVPEGLLGLLLGG